MSYEIKLKIPPISDNISSTINLVNFYSNSETSAQDKKYGTFRSKQLSVYAYLKIWYQSAKKSSSNKGNMEIITFENEKKTPTGRIDYVVSYTQERACSYNMKLCFNNNTHSLPACVRSATVRCIAIHICIKTLFIFRVGALIFVESMHDIFVDHSTIFYFQKRFGFIQTDILFNIHQTEWRN